MLGLGLLLLGLGLLLLGLGLLLLGLGLGLLLLVLRVRLLWGQGLLLGPGSGRTGLRGDAAGGRGGAAGRPALRGSATGKQDTALRGQPTRALRGSGPAGTAG
ncbi:hypothetical protein, partial [Streptomyces cuspidosporus]|uniref:hypothetical protein n=1 Tax=Streptomyces cuspidosporus TaxID=66882 RepID=UPI0031FC711F